MSRIRFNPVFFCLLLLCGLSAFIVPQEYTNSLRGRADGLFAPVAYPVRRLAQTLAPKPVIEGIVTGGFDRQRAPADAQAELDRLRGEVASLSVQIDRLRLLNANRDLAGRVRDYARPFKVLGGDGRSLLTLSGSTADGVAPGMAVVCNDTLVGRVSASSGLGIQVQLITHTRFRVGGAFYRFDPQTTGASFTKLRTPPPLAEGRGNGRLAVTNLTMQQVRDAGLGQGDLLLVEDSDDWSLPTPGQALLINGQRLGVIELIQEQSKAPLFAEITIRPPLDLLRLDEVMVVVGQAVAPKPAPEVKKPAPKAPPKEPPRKKGEAVGIATPREDVVGPKFPDDLVGQTPPENLVGQTFLSAIAWASGGHSGNLVGQTFLSAIAWASGGHSCPPETMQDRRDSREMRASSTGQECPALVSSWQTRMSAPPSHSPSVASSLRPSVAATSGGPCAG